jgi:hypothetical protein
MRARSAQADAARDLRREGRATEQRAAKYRTDGTCVICLDHGGRRPAPLDPCRRQRSQLCRTLKGWDRFCCRISTSGLAWPAGEPLAEVASGFRTLQTD